MIEPKPPIPGYFEQTPRRHDQILLLLTPLSKLDATQTTGQSQPNKITPYDLPIRLRQRDPHWSHQQPLHSTHQGRVPLRISRLQRLGNVLGQEPVRQQLGHVRGRQLRGRAAGTRGARLRNAVGEFRRAFGPAHADAGAADLGKCAVAHGVAEVVGVGAEGTAVEGGVDVDEAREVGCGYGGCWGGGGGGGGPLELVVDVVGDY